LDSAAPGDPHHSLPPSYVTGTHNDKMIMLIDEDLMKWHRTTRSTWVLHIPHIAINSVVGCDSNKQAEKVEIEGEVLSE